MTPAATHDPVLAALHVGIALDALFEAAQPVASLSYAERNRILALVREQLQPAIKQAAAAAAVPDQVIGAGWPLDRIGKRRTVSHRLVAVLASENRAHADPAQQLEQVRAENEKSSRRIDELLRSIVQLESRIDASDRARAAR